VVVPGAARLTERTAQSYCNVQNVRSRSTVGRSIKRLLGEAIRPIASSPVSDVHYQEKINRLGRCRISSFYFLRVKGSSLSIQHLNR